MGSHWKSRLSSDRIRVMRVRVLLFIMIADAVKEHSSYHKLRSRNVTNGFTDLTYEIRTSDEKALSAAVSGLPGIQSSTVMSHDGELCI